MDPYAETETDTLRSGNWSRRGLCGRPSFCYNRRSPSDKHSSLRAPSPKISHYSASGVWHQTTGGKEEGTLWGESFTNLWIRGQSWLAPASPPPILPTHKQLLEWGQPQPLPGEHSGVPRESMQNQDPGKLTTWASNAHGCRSPHWFKSPAGNRGPWLYHIGSTSPFYRKKRPREPPSLERAQILYELQSSRHSPGRKSCAPAAGWKPKHLIPVACMEVLLRVQLPVMWWQKTPNANRLPSGSPFWDLSAKKQQNLPQS